MVILLVPGSVVCGFSWCPSSLRQWLSSESRFLPCRARSLVRTMPTAQPSARNGTIRNQLVQGRRLHPIQVGIWEGKKGTPGRPSPTGTVSISGAPACWWYVWEEDLESTQRRELERVSEDTQARPSAITGKRPFTASPAGGSVSP